MSGGSFNYLCFWEPLDSREDDLLRMEERLLTLGFRSAADETARIRHNMFVDQRLRSAWQAIEWRDSNDWGTEQAIEEIEKLGWAR